MSPQQILTTVMTNIVVDKSTDNAEPLSILFFNAKESLFQSVTKIRIQRKSKHCLKLSRNMIGLFPKMGVSDWLLHCVTN